jgi:hypothetical protein
MEFDRVRTPQIAPELYVRLHTETGHSALLTPRRLSADFVEKLGVLNR